MARKRRTRKISPDLERELIALSAKGLSSRALSEWASLERGVDVSHQSIASLLRQTRVERADVAKVVVREALVGHVTSDLDILRAEQVRIDKLTKRLHVRAHKSLDRLDEVAAPGPKKLEGKALKDIVDTAADMAELALKASDRVRAFASEKLRLSGADETPNTEGQDGEVSPAQARALIRGLFTKETSVPDEGSE